MKLRLVFALAMIAVLSNPAYAYIDPGTGSLLLQGLLALIVGALATIKLYWKTISDVVARLFGRRQPSDRK
ncbi:MAG TPA: hypothetical protein PKZ22_09500 [Accumulibacter sp.]|jgi:hypothetical protein|nr:hypothetical protein [Accumulibacter sp.]